MQRRHKLGFMIFLIILMATAYVANSANASVVSTDLVIDRLDGDALSTVASTPLPAASRLSCKNSKWESRCTELEQQILDSIVRLELYYEDQSSKSSLAKKPSHGTIKDGRYLVIHNHFQISFSPSTEQSEDIALTLAMYDTSGVLLMLHTGSFPFSVVAEEQETLVLDFGTKSNGQGYFKWLGLRSASFMTLQDLTLQPGDEVAQVDYDGDNTFITWTTVEEVITNDGVPRIIMGSALAKGASGGGVFWNGYHIANNWGMIEQVGEGGQVNARTSVAALNPSSWPMNH